MDISTNHAIEGFVSFLDQSLRDHEEFKSVHLDNEWQAQGDKIVLKISYNKQKAEVIFDAREVAENRKRYTHVLENVLDQIAEKFNINRLT